MNQTKTANAIWLTERRKNNRKDTHIPPPPKFIALQWSGPSSIKATYRIGFLSDHNQVFHHLVSRKERRRFFQQIACCRYGQSKHVGHSKASPTVFAGALLQNWFHGVATCLD